MARGYPSRHEDHHSWLPGAILPAGVCAVCKKRPIDHGSLCTSCASVLEAGEPVGQRS